MTTKEKEIQELADKIEKEMIANGEFAKWPTTRKMEARQRAKYQLGSDYGFWMN